jgi:CDP-diacylglycerol--glycerol-3-phosphate 3-phosphatidyltransferase
MFLFSIKGLWWSVASLVVFSLAAISDYFDGHLAHKHNMITDFGKLMDPIADKILVLAAFVSFVQMQLVTGWMVVIIMLREILVTSFRLFALNKGKVISAGKLGKGKTFSQMIIIFLILGFIVFKEVMLTYYTWNPFWDQMFKVTIDVFMWLIVFLTVYSGCSYFWQNRKIIASL